MTQKTLHQSYHHTDTNLKLHLKTFLRGPTPYLLIGSAGSRNYVTIPFHAAEDLLTFLKAFNQATTPLKRHFTTDLMRIIGTTGKPTLGN